jgi:hypothetical protein
VQYLARRLREAVGEGGHDVGFELWGDCMCGLGSVPHGEVAVGDYPEAARLAASGACDPHVEGLEAALRSLGYLLRDLGLAMPRAAAAAR